MKIKRIKVISYLLALCLLGLTNKSIAQQVPLQNRQQPVQNKYSQNETFEISNSAQCSVEMNLPARSIFISSNFINYAVTLNNLKKQLNQDSTFVYNGLRFQKNKLSVLSTSIINHLLNRSLPFVKTKADAEKTLKNTRINLTETPNFVDCFIADNLQLNNPEVYLRSLNSTNLSKLAQDIILAKKQASCFTKNPANELDLYPIINLKLNLEHIKNWDQFGFDFWISFKIYLSLLWIDESYTEFSKNSYNKISLLIPIEEQILLNSDGCHSISRPECNSDYLSSAELRTLFSPIRNFEKLSSQSLQMSESFKYNQVNIETNIDQMLQTELKDNKLITAFQKTQVDLSLAITNALFEASEIYSKVFAQKNIKMISDDLQSDLNQTTNLEEEHYLCLEYRLISEGQEKLFKMDMELLQQNAQEFDSYMKYGMNVSTLLTYFDSLNKVLKPFCQNVDEKQKNIKKVMDIPWSNFRPWFIDYMKEFKAIYQDITNEKNKFALQRLTEIKDNNYVNGICSSAADCSRTLISQIAELYRLSLHKKSFLKTSVISTNLFNENSEKTACKYFDPFEASRNNQKKLLADIGSSILFGWTALPVMFDINFKSKKPISFNKLVSDGTIKFETEFDQGSIQKSLALNFGALLDIPCYMNYSETGHNIDTANQQSFIFQGISVEKCSSQKTENSVSKGTLIDSLSTNKSKDYNLCGKCMINITTASTLKSLQNGNIFSPLRFAIKLIQSITRYSAIEKDNFINPRKFTIDKNFLTEAYIKNNYKIPERCIPMLSKGLPCEENICSALTVKAFEKQTGFKVKAISMIPSNQQSLENQKNYSQAWIKTHSHKDEIPVRLSCNENTEYFNMKITSSEIMRIKSEALK